MQTYQYKSGVPLLEQGEPRSREGYSWLIPVDDDCLEYPLQLPQKQVLAVVSPHPRRHTCSHKIVLSSLTCYKRREAKLSDYSHLVRREKQFNGLTLVISLPGTADIQQITALPARSLNGSN